MSVERREVSGSVSVNADTDGAAYQTRRFVPSYEALGIVVDFLTRQAQFGEFRAAKLVIAVKQQIATGNHVCAFRGERLIGYAGWLNISTEMGERWLERQGELKPVPNEVADAAALTIVQVEDPRVLSTLIRAVRRINKGKRVFFRRDYQGRKQKRQTVLNV